MKAFDEPWEPWMGKNFRRGGLLIMSESAYAWPNGEPERDHPTNNTVKYWAIERFADRHKEGRYAATLTRALCDEQSPSEKRRLEEWSNVAYSIYVQQPMSDKRQRPNAKNYKESEAAFLILIEGIGPKRLRPGRVVITGKTVWNNMPPCCINPPDKSYGAYRLSDDSLVWCMALPHPRASVQGTDWKAMSEKIADFRSRDLPTRYVSGLETALKW